MPPAHILPLSAVARLCGFFSGKDIPIASTQTRAQHFREPLMKKILAFVFMLLVLPPSGGLAQELPFQREICFGFLSLIPSLTVQEVYDDNIYYGNGGNSRTELKESDWITHTKPGLLLDYNLNHRGSLKLGYDGDFARYDKHSINDWRNHRGLLDLDYQAPGGLIVKIKNMLTDTQDPYGAPNEYGRGRRTMRWFNDFAGAAGFKFSEQFKTLTFYNFYKQRYDSKIDFAQNYTAGEIGAGGEVKVADKTWLFLRAYSGRRGYDTHRAGTTNSNDASYGWKKVTTGLNWDSEARFEGELNIGYQWNSFENSLDKNKLAYRDTSSWISNTSVRYLQSATRTFTLSFVRNMQQLAGGQNGCFTNTALGIGLRQQVSPRILLLAGCSYAKNMYNSQYAFYAHRKDKIPLAQASLKYLISDWLAIGLGFNRFKDSSTDRINEYRVNRVSVSLDMNPSFLPRRPQESSSDEE